MRVRAVCTHGISDVGDVKREIAFLRPLLHFKGFAQGLCDVCFKRLVLCLPKNQEDVPVLYNITPTTHHPPGSATHTPIQANRDVCALNVYFSPLDFLTINLVLRLYLRDSNVCRHECGIFS